MFLWQTALLEPINRQNQPIRYASDKCKKKKQTLQPHHWETKPCGDHHEICSTYFMPNFVSIGQWAFSRRPLKIDLSHGKFSSPQQVIAEL
jgi:hypothetical protein